MTRSSMTFNMRILNTREIPVAEEFDEILEHVDLMEEKEISITNHVCLV